MAKLTTIYWRDIPAQVYRAAGPQANEKGFVITRFAVAIDRAAMRAGQGLEQRLPGRVAARKAGPVTAMSKRP